MTDFSNIKDNIKGKYDELKGEMNQKQGKGVKGGLQKLKGKALQKKAEIQSRLHSDANTTKTGHIRKEDY